jgi:hypothetical protein
VRTVVAERSAEALQFADDALISPLRVFSRHPQDQLSDLAADEAALFYAAALMTRALRDSRKKTWKRGPD